MWEFPGKEKLFNLFIYSHVLEARLSVPPLTSSLPYLNLFHASQLLGKQIEVASESTTFSDGLPAEYLI